jgi:glutamine synthetase
LERYNHTMGIEVNLMIDLFKTQILPVAVDYQKTLSKSLFQVDQLLSGKVVKRQKAYLQEMALLIEEGLEALEVLEKAKQQADALPNQEKAFFYCEHMLEKMEQLREKADKLEQRVDDRLWPLPKYRELLFMI